MDSERFDGFVRTFGQTRSRRQTLRGLAGVLAVGALARGERAEEAGAHNPLKQCKKKSGKQKQACLKKAKAHNATHTGAAPAPSGTSVCTPTCSGGRNCGGDGCNGSCGSCTAPQTCGGGGTAGVCGCTPTTCAAQNRTCGPLADGCGTTLDCGTCGGGHLCADSGACTDECPEGAQDINGGCFRSETCGTGCGSSICGAGFSTCYCAETVGGVPVCFKNDNFCSEGDPSCEADGDCPTGKACVAVSCFGCGGPAAVCLAPCPVSPPEPEECGGSCAPFVGSFCPTGCVCSDDFGGTCVKP